MRGTRIHRSSRNAFTPAFTLVELLVVIGIIAVLIAVLLPALRKARMSAQSVQCLSNIRQISNASIMWANDHNGWMPSGGGFTPYRWDPSSKTTKAAGGTDTGEERKDNQADWICWARRKDFLTGYAASVSDQNITYSGLAKYLGSKRRDHNSDDQANTMDPKLDQVYRCPADSLDNDNRPSHADNSHGYYRYSYAMNSLYANNAITKPLARFDGSFNGKVSSIRKPSEKVLFVCEDEKTLDDGAFSPNATAFSQNLRCDNVAARHETRKRKATNLLNTAEGNEDAKGNVGFCDGHAEFFSRKDALRARFSGNSTPDPIPF